MRWSGGGGGRAGTVEATDEVFIGLEKGGVANVLAHVAVASED